VEKKKRRHSLLPFSNKRDEGGVKREKRSKSFGGEGERGGRGAIRNGAFFTVKRRREP